MYTGDVASNDITVVMSNAKTRRAEPRRTPTSLAATASRMFGKPSTQYLNAMTIATSEAIADTDAILIFVMEGADVKNKRPAIKPLTINLPDGRQIESTHICDIDIPGLPTTLTGHIVPNLAIASLFGIRVLCKAGCKVIFDDDKCDVFYQDKLILRGYKDPSTDLWTLPIVPTPANVWTALGTPALGPHVKMQAASVQKACVLLPKADAKRKPVSVSILLTRVTERVAPYGGCPATTRPLFRSCPTPIDCGVHTLDQNESERREICTPIIVQSKNFNNSLMDARMLT